MAFGYVAPTEAHTLTGGAGNDIFVFSSETSVLDSGDAAATDDVIKDYTASYTTCLDSTTANTDNVAGASSAETTNAIKDVSASALVKYHLLQQMIFLLKC